MIIMNKKRLNELINLYKNTEAIDEDYMYVEMQKRTRDVMDSPISRRMDEIERKIKRTVLSKYAFATTSVENKKYYLFKVTKDYYRGEGDYTMALAIPATTGDKVYSGIDKTSYEFTHAGHIFRKVAYLLDEIVKGASKKRMKGKSCKRR